MLFIRDGLVSVGSRGKGAVYFVRGPGSLLNSEAIVGARADYEIRALTDARICLLDASTVRNWMGNERTPAQAIALLSLEQLATQGADLNARQGSCVSRVARFAVELQRARAEGTAAHLDKRVVARILGMRPETLSRALTRLQQSGALKRSPPFTIGDAELLAKAAA